MTEWLGTTYVSAGLVGANVYSSPIPRHAFIRQNINVIYDTPLTHHRTSMWITT